MDNYEGVSGIVFPENGTPLFQEDFQAEAELIGKDINNNYTDIFTSGVLEGFDFSAGSGVVNIGSGLGRDSLGRRVFLAAGVSYGPPDGETVDIVARHRWITEDYIPDGSSEVKQKRIHSCEIIHIAAESSPETGDVTIVRVSRSGVTVSIIEDLRTQIAPRERIIDYIKNKVYSEYIEGNKIQIVRIPDKISKDGTANRVIFPPFKTDIAGEEFYKSSPSVLDASNIDTGEPFVFGTDYYVWAGVPASGHEPVLKLSVSPTAPTGLASPKIIGGFYYGKIRNSITTTDVSDGIVPNSCWDLNHMPKCYLLGLADPSNYQLGGMVEVIPGSLWVDIYLASAGVGTGFNRKVQSKINVLPISGTEGLRWFDFVQRGKNSGKRLLTYQEFCAAAIGSPMGRDADNLHGWTRTSNTSRVKTGATVAGMLMLIISSATIPVCIMSGTVLVTSGNGWLI